MMMVPPRTARAVLREATFRLRTESAAMMVMPPWTTRAVLRETTFRLRTESAAMMMMPPRTARAVLREATSPLRTKFSPLVVAHPRTLRAILCEAALLPFKLRMVVMFAARPTLARLRTVLRESSLALSALRTKALMAMTLPRPLRPTLGKALSPLRPHRPARLHSRSLRSGPRPLIATRLRPWILRPRLGLRTILRLLLAPPLHVLLKALAHLFATLHLLRKPLAPLLLKLLLALLPRLRSALATLTALRRTRRILWSRILRLRVAPVIAARPGRTPLAIAFTALRSGLSRLCIAVTTIARAALHRTPVGLEKLIARHPAIAPAIELLQSLRCILHLLLIDHAVVIRIEQIEERGAATHVARATTALPIRALLKIWTRPVTITPLRQTRRCIWGQRRSLRTLWNRRSRRCRGRRAFLRVKQRSRQRQRDRRGEKRLQFHSVWDVAGKRPQAAAVMGFIH